jgi:hypothetical protein
MKCRMHNCKCGYCGTTEQVSKTSIINSTPMIAGELPPMQEIPYWLRDIGAVRPMTPAGEECLVLGKWTNGQYPIMWRRYRDEISRDFNGNPFPQRQLVQEWRIFGIPTRLDLTREDCERILAAIK